MEDKTRIVSALYDLLQETRAGSDVSELSYFSDERGERVKVKFEGGGSRVIDITADSGIALCRDVLRSL